MSIPLPNLPKIQPKDVPQPKKRGPKPGQIKKKPISKAERYYNLFGNEMYNDFKDVTSEKEIRRALTIDQLIVKYNPQCNEGPLTRYMVTQLLKMKKDKIEKEIYEGWLREQHDEYDDAIYEEHCKNHPEYFMDDETIVYEKEDNNEVGAYEEGMFATCN